MLLDSTTQSRLLAERSVREANERSDRGSYGIHFTGMNILLVYLCVFFF